MNTAVSILILLASVVMHEVAHGYVADKEGDPTARLQGRLSLNPLVHIDWVGSVILPVLMVVTNAPFVFGWAKPVPVNTYNLKDYRWSPLRVAIAGPIVNIILAIVFGLVIRFFGAALSASVMSLLFTTVVINTVLAVFNMIPIPPLDGSHVLAAFIPSLQEKIATFVRRYWFFTFLIVIFIWPVFSPIVSFLVRAITGTGF